MSCRSKVLTNGGDYLGDIAIAHGVAAREAKEAGKQFADHAVHLAVHGVLHLLGYDHEAAAPSRRSWNLWKPAFWPK